jgi:xylulose-5-phosphate/fructose-6-phosphate phosphoketolase
MFTFDAKLSSTVRAEQPATRPMSPPARPLSADEIGRMQQYWDAANYLTVGQIYLKDNPLLRRALTVDDIKVRLLGHWGTSPGLNFIYVHLNRLIRAQDADVIYIFGPGHGGPAGNANAYLEGSYAAVHHEVSQDEAGMLTLFRQFSTPGGVPSHMGAHLPGSIHEGGELGYALLHAYGAAFDNPDLLVACVIGDGEAETAPLEGSWKANKFLNPVRDGAVLPILHLNGYKISGPTVYARIDEDELLNLYRGHGYKPCIVEGDDPATMHQWFAHTLDECYREIRAIQQDARSNGFTRRPTWPMIILRTPKGWTGPKEVDGIPVEGTFRAHQVPLAAVREKPEHRKQLETWLRSYRPEFLFNEHGRLMPALAALAPEGDRRMGANPHANGGRRLVDLQLPDIGEYSLQVPGPGRVVAEAPVKLGQLLRDVFRLNTDNFRLFCPDETESNRLGAVFEATSRCNVAATVDIDDHQAPDGRVLEVLSEHCCQGWLEGYLLTGRHGLWSSYEAFAQIVDSMLTQHVKWLKESKAQPWRRPIASMNVFLSSHVWRQDHNGYSHQAPGYVDNALVQKNELVRIYYPPDGNCLVHVFDRALRSRNLVNVITCGKQPQLQWLSADEARAHCSHGIGIWSFASNDEGNPDIVLACAGDVPTIETVAAAWLLRKHVPGIRIRLVNVVDMSTLMRADVHPDGMDDLSFTDLFPLDVAVIFSHHGYPFAIRSVIQGRERDDRFHVRGYINEGSTTTPFDMVVVNQVSRFDIAMDALRRVERLRQETVPVVEMFSRKLDEHRIFSRENLVDLPEIVNWRWTDDFSDPTGPAPLAHPASGQSFTNA